MIASYQTHERKTIVNDLDLDPNLIEQASSNTVVEWVLEHSVMGSVQGKDMVPVSVADSELQAGLDDLYGQISRFTIPFLMEDMPNGISPAAGFRPQRSDYLLLRGNQGQEV